MKRLPKFRYLVAAFATVVGTNTILLTPTSAAPIDGLSVSDIAFGEIAIDSSTTKDIVVSNSSERDLVLTNIKLEKAGHEKFVLQCNINPEAKGTKQVNKKTNNVNTGCKVSIDNEKAKVNDDLKNIDIKVEYQSKADAKDKGAAVGKLSAKIVKSTVQKLDIPTPKTGLVYNTKEQTAFDNLSENIEATNITATDAGTYNYTLKIKDTSKFTWSDDTTADKTGTWTIAKADFTPTISVEDWAYGDEASNPEIKNNLSNGRVIVLYKARHQDWTTKQPTEVGAYSARVVVLPTKNYNRASATTTFRITKRAVTVNVIGNSKEVVYNGKEQKIQGFEFNVEDSVYDLSKIYVNGLALAPLTATEVGVYENTLDEDWFINTDNRHFDVTFKVVSGTLTIKEAPVTPVDPVAPVTKKTPLTPNTGLVSTTNTTAAATSENATIIAAIALTSVATLGLYGLIRRHS